MSELIRQQGALLRLLFETAAMLDYRELFFAAVSRDAGVLGNLPREMSRELLSNVDFMKECVARNGLALQYAGPLRDDYTVRAAINNNGLAQWASERLRVNSGVMTDAVWKTPWRCSGHPMSCGVRTNLCVTSSV